MAQKQVDDTIIDTTLNSYKNLAYQYDSGHVQMNSTNAANWVYIPSADSYLMSFPTGKYLPKTGA